MSQNLLLLRLVSSALNEVDANGGLPSTGNPAPTSFVELVMQHDIRQQVTKDEVENFLSKTPNDLFAEMCEKK